MHWRKTPHLVTPAKAGGPLSLAAVHGETVRTVIARPGHSSLFLERCVVRAVATARDWFALTDRRARPGVRSSARHGAQALALTPAFAGMTI
jgi:hypothetical protein